MKTIPRILFLAILVFGLVIARGYWNATRDPIVRNAYVKVANWPKGTAPVKVLLVSDIHVAGPDMPPARVVRIATKLNRLRPDLVLIAGDLVSDKRMATRFYPVPEVVAPLRTFRAPLGVVVVMGNHDHWYDPDAFRTELPKAGLIFLANEAVKRGPLVIGGVDDEFSGHAGIGRTFAAMEALKGPRIILTHSPDIVPDLPHPVAAVFAGHTHCSQILWPNGHPVFDVSRYGGRFRCGNILDKRQRVIVGAGLGTSILWLRYYAPPDVWLVTLGP